MYEAGPRSAGPLRRLAARFGGICHWFSVAENEISKSGQRLADIKRDSSVLYSQPDPWDLILLIFKSYTPRTQQNLRGLETSSSQKHKKRYYTDLAETEGKIKVVVDVVLLEDLCQQISLFQSLCPLSTFRLYQKKNNQAAIKAVLLVFFFFSFSFSFFSFVPFTPPFPQDRQR